MQVPWFFATTPAPSLPYRRQVTKRVGGFVQGTWWTRAAKRLEAWGERSQRRHIASLKVF
jgi:hypothetical protein